MRRNAQVESPASIMMRVALALNRCNRTDSGLSTFFSTMKPDTQGGRHAASYHRFSNSFCLWLPALPPAATPGRAGKRTRAITCVRPGMQSANRLGASIANVVTFLTGHRRNQRRPREFRRQAAIRSIVDRRLPGHGQSLGRRPLRDAEIRRQKGDAAGRRQGRAQDAAGVQVRYGVNSFRDSAAPGISAIRAARGAFRHF